jgi:hypothetical protein
LRGDCIAEQIHNQIENTDEQRFDRGGIDVKKTFRHYWDYGSIVVFCLWHEIKPVSKRFHAGKKLGKVIRNCKI